MKRVSRSKRAAADIDQKARDLLFMLSESRASDVSRPCSSHRDLLLFFSKAEYGGPPGSRTSRKWGIKNRYQRDSNVESPDVRSNIASRLPSPPISSKLSISSHSVGLLLASDGSVDGPPYYLSHWHSTSMPQRANRLLDKGLAFPN